MGASWGPHFDNFDLESEKNALYVSYDMCLGNRRNEGQSENRQAIFARVRRDFDLGKLLSSQQMLSAIPN
jgi:hypothetical protein